MGRGGLRALRHPPRFHHDHRFKAGSGACGRHELSCVPDSLHIEEDRTRLFVQREIIEQICDIDIELVADRNDARKSDGSLRAPIYHRGCDRTGLRNQRQRTTASADDVAKLAFNATPGNMTPRQFGPTMRIL